MMILLTWLATAMVMHPAQETLCELSWNSETSRLEVSLRLSQLDERHLLGPDASRLRADEKALRTTATQILHDQLAWGNEKDLNHFADDKFNSSNEHSAVGSPLGKYHWIGRQPEGAHVWWHFEYEPSNQRRPTHVGSHLLPYLRDVSPSAHQHAGALSTFVILNATPKDANSPTTRPPRREHKTSVALTNQKRVGKLPW